MKILLVTSKSPFLSEDYDGGSVLVKQLLDFFYRNGCNPKIKMDVLLLRERTTVFNDFCLSFIKKQKFFFLPPVRLEEVSRFEERIANAEKTNHKIKALSDEYDIILTVHVSNAFGIETLSKQIQKKIIILPMFCGISYKLSGETVPDEYFDYEMAAFRACYGIVTPSKSEFRQLIESYKVNSNKIKKIHRGIDCRNFSYKKRNPYSETINILYIATIKKQKNQIDCIEILKQFNKRSIKSKLHFVGGIGDNDYHKMLLEQIKRYGLIEQVSFHNIVMPNVVAEIAHKCHFAISVARWETFGRGIFEGMATGLPTLVYKDINCLWEHLQDGNGICSVERSPSAMANKIERIWNDKEYYNQLSQLASQSVLPFEVEGSMYSFVKSIIRYYGKEDKEIIGNNYSERLMV